MTFDLQVHKDPDCMGYLRHIKLIFHLALFFLRLVHRQHEQAKFLVVTLQPVFELHLSFCIKDSFLFAESIRQLNPKSDQFFLCSFDICSLFTNEPLDENVQLCAETLYSGKFISPIFPKQYLLNLCKWLLVMLNSASTTHCNDRLMGCYG